MKQTFTVKMESRDGINDEALAAVIRARFQPEEVKVTVEEQSHSVAKVTGVNFARRKGTEHIIASKDRAQELLDFIEREPVMRWLVDRYERVQKKITKDACLGDYASEACLVLETKGKSAVASLTWRRGGRWDSPDDQTTDGWCITSDGRHYPEETWVGKKLDHEAMQRIIAILKLNSRRG